jgi:hypothetical protein
VESTSIKDILYEEIRTITEKRIQQEFSNKNYKKIITALLEQCIPKISKLDGNKDEIFGTFFESMMHYLLTNALIPSQRKIAVKGIDVDIIIPDFRTLESSPKDALVLHFVKTGECDLIKKHLTKLKEIQPIEDNIWIIAKSELDIPSKTYQLDSKPNLTAILDDINEFISSRPQAKFRIFKT